MNIPVIDRGQYLVIRVGQSLDQAELIEKRPTLARIHDVIKPPQCPGFVTISIDPYSRQAQTVMAVDDTGRIDGLPVNELASLIANQQIHGDVVICRDEDFE